eukprot:TRINITY_DN19680_c1_g1_i1.p1 TRINITY_DN19680_c1_g1~~TRINITY_DN19680_c1_g1_i1.p1  ORF type:complete len:476 (+),score=254.81 TRINITY_DN19680_c1_g1_i1:80-1429(+)
MGEADVDPAILEKTRKELQPIIKAPKLTDRLLKKPPFRFLHDIITNVIKTTQFASALYTDDELDSSKVTEKEAKMAFLQKMISSVNYTLKLDPPLKAKPIKIVSGLEPEHTNHFLQELARATKSPKEKSDKAVQKVLQKFAEKQAAAKKQEDPGKGAAPAAAEKAPPPEKDKAEPAAKPAPEPAPAKEERPAAESPAPPPAAAPAPAAERPSTALKEKEAEGAAPRTVRTKKEKEEVAAHPVNIIMDNKKEGGKGLEKGMLDTDSEDENVAAGEEQPFAKGVTGGEAGADGAQGHVMRKIEEQKTQLKKQQEEQMKAAKEDTSIELKTTRKPRQDREVFSTEVSKLRDMLQTLVKTTNPLGKTFDYVQEDIDSMAKEYTSWKRQGADTKAQALEIERANQEALQPLQAQLQELEDAINDQLNKIRTVKANIIKNDSTIETLLKMVINAK